MLTSYRDPATELDGSCLLLGPVEMHVPDPRLRRAYPPIRGSLARI